MDPYKKVRPGERLVISARAWNRAQEAADRVLGAGAGLAAGEQSQIQPWTVIARVSRATYDSDAAKFPAAVAGLEVGHAIDLRTFQGGMLSSVPQDKLTGNIPEQRVSQEKDLPAFSRDLRAIELKSVIASFGTTGSTWGVIRSIDIGDQHVTMSVAVSGLFTCRVFAFALADRVSGPLPIPQNIAASLAPLWRPYAFMSPAGSGSIVSLGAFYRLSGDDWPRVYEALVRL